LRWTSSKLARVFSLLTMCAVHWILHLWIVCKNKGKARNWVEALIRCIWSYNKLQQITTKFKNSSKDSEGWMRTRVKRGEWSVRGRRGVRWRRLFRRSRTAWTPVTAPTLMARSPTPGLPVQMKPPNTRERSHTHRDGSGAAGRKKKAPWKPCFQKVWFTQRKEVDRVEGSLSGDGNLVLLVWIPGHREILCCPNSFWLNVWFFMILNHIRLLDGLWFLISPFLE